MSSVKFISDLHFGHKNIAKFRHELGLSCEEEHREFIVDKWNASVNKRDVVWVLGDACFKADILPTFSRMRGQKFLVLGNHDLNAKLFEPYFNRVCGLYSYKGFWLSHCPIHPAELRGKPNIHGHVHSHSLDDSRYFNACCENVGYEPIDLDEIRSVCHV